MLYGLVSSIDKKKSKIVFFFNSITNYNKYSFLDNII